MKHTHVPAGVMDLSKATVHAGVLCTGQCRLCGQLAQTENIADRRGPVPQQHAGANLILQQTIKQLSTCNSHHQHIRLGSTPMAGKTPQPGINTSSHLAPVKTKRDVFTMTDSEGSGLAKQGRH